MIYRLIGHICIHIFRTISQGDLILSTIVPEVMVHQLDAAVCYGVVAMRTISMKQKDIALHQHITQGEVSEIFRTKAETGVSTPRPRPGWPLKTTVRQDRLAARLYTASHTRTTSTFRSEWQSQINVHVSRSLVNSCLIKCDLALSSMNTKL